MTKRANKTAGGKTAAKKRAPRKAAAKPPRKAAPKAAPKSVTKAADELVAVRPLSNADFVFCQTFVQTQKQVEAYRAIDPNAKDPHRAAHRMMQRPEIREHIRTIYREISKRREQAATVSAHAALLSLEVADDRLMELMGQRRKSRAEMLTKDTKMLLVDGAIPTFDDDGNMTLKPGAELQEKLKTEAAPIEDADLLKAIKLVYDRKQGIIKAEKEGPAAPVTVMLYKPKWFGQPRTPQTLEATA